ncbi:hypothetical protein HA402_014554 [Bradysia odoriphaga]|nr:hypothetical protein HA402_014554 [Bradysia odoriphaga]
MADLRKTSSIINYTIPIIFVILHGSWSDIYGRKMTLLLPCIGFILQALSLFLCTCIKSWDGYVVMLISTIPKCLAGSDVTFRMAAQSYISDISTNTDRTVRTGLISAAFTLGVPMGFALGGTAVKASMKSEIAFLCSAGICTLAFIQILLFVDNRPLKTVMEQQEKATSPDCISNNPTEGKKWFTFSNFMSVLRSLMLSFEGVSNSDRIQIFVLLTAIVCVNAPIQGEFGVMYLYLRKKLSWDSGDYGIFSTYVSLVGVAGTVLSMGVLCTVLKLTDPVVGFIAGISQFGGSFMYAFAYNNVMIYLAPAIDMLNGTMGVVAKSMLSKLCPPEDFGKMFSLLAVIELLVPLVFDPTYITIYQHTMDIYPGSVFFLSALMTVPPQLIYIFYIWKNRNSGSCEITKSEKCNITTSDDQSLSKYSQTSSG